MKVADKYTASMEEHNFSTFLNLVEKSKYEEFKEKVELLITEEMKLESEKTIKIRRRCCCIKRKDKFLSNKKTIISYTKISQEPLQ